MEDLLKLLMDSWEEKAAVTEEDYIGDDGLVLYLLFDRWFTHGISLAEIIY